MWRDYDYWLNSGFIIEWFNGYKKRRPQKREELLPIAWYLSRY